MPTTSLARHESPRLRARRHLAPARLPIPLRIGVLGLCGETLTTLIEPLTYAALPVHAIRIHLDGADAGADGGAVSFTRAILDAPLDGLVLAGSPADHRGEPASLPGFRELMEIVDYARGFVPSTLGLGVGGQLLAVALGLRLERLERAIHGLVPQRVLARDHALVGGGSEVFFAAEARRFRITDESVDHAVVERKITPLAHSRDAGVSIFESTDGRCVAHLGHPERKPDRAPDGAKLSAFHDSARESARAHAAAFFAAWVDRVHELGQRGRPGSQHR